jgi:hypothetical protein
MKRVITASTRTLCSLADSALIVALTLALLVSVDCLKGGPAEMVPKTSAVVTASTTPANLRVIEVVDQLKPAKWHVSQAVEWLDRYTSSNMKTVSKCSGRAWKCVVIRAGRLPGNVLAQATCPGGWVKIDTAKVDRRGYFSNLSREKILAHELFHTFGYRHSAGRNLMSTSLPRSTLWLTAAQRAYLRSR